MLRLYNITRLISPTALQQFRGDLFGLEIDAAVSELRKTLDKGGAEPRSVKIVVEAEVPDPIQAA